MKKIPQNHDILCAEVERQTEIVLGGRVTGGVEELSIYSKLACRMVQIWHYSNLQ